MPNLFTFIKNIKNKKENEKKYLEDLLFSKIRMFIVYIFKSYFINRHLYGTVIKRCGLYIRGTSIITTYYYTISKSFFWNKYIYIIFLIFKITQS